VDFAHLASTIAKFKQLRSLFLTRVNWDTNTIDYSEPILQSQTFPDSVVSLHLYHINLGQFMTWLLAQPEVPRISAFYAGPVEHQWNLGILFFVMRVTPTLLEEGFLVLPDLGMPLYAYSPCPGTTTVEDVVKFLSPLNQELQEIGERFQARHGFSIQAQRLRHVGQNLHIIRAHRFLYHDAQMEAGLATFPITWFARLLLTFLEDFVGTLFLEVDVPSVGVLQGLKVDWEFLEDVFSAESHRGIEAVVFVAVTEISFPRLEDLISTKLSKSYGRGLLRFERGEDLSK